MKKRLLLSGAIITLFSCHTKPEQSSKIDKSTSNETILFDYNRLTGSYEGDFEGTGDIRIVLRHVTGTHAVGYDLHKGLRRNISGKMEPAANGFKFHLQEPGDNPFDGIFDFSIDTTTFMMSGTWAPVNNKNLSTKKYNLAKQTKGTDSARTSVNMEGPMFDSTGAEYYFEEGGLCIYRYYTDKNDPANKSQYEEIKGNWKKTATEYIIDWQKNTVFPNTRSIFKIVPYPELEDTYYLEGEGRKIEPRLAG